MRSLHMQELSTVAAGAISADHIKEGFLIGAGVGLAIFVVGVVLRSPTVPNSTWVKELAGILMYAPNVAFTGGAIGAILSLEITE